MENQDTQKVMNSTYVFDSVARSINDTVTYITHTHPEYTISEWNAMYHKFLKRCIAERIGYTSLPEPDLKNFYISAKISAFFEELVLRMHNEANEDSTFYKLNTIYQNCKRPEFLAAKKAISENLNKFSEAHKTKSIMDHQGNQALRDVFFSIKEIKDYFSSFVFDLKNKHSAQHELTISKNIHFQTEYTPDSLDPGVIFRFIDCVTRALSKIIIKDGEIINQDEIVSYILLPKIEHGCHLCNHENDITFNHEEGLLQEINSDVCISFLKKQNTNLLKAKIATKGKLIFIDDIMSIAHKNFDFINEILNFGLKNEISTYLNSWEGRNGFMNISAQLFNVAYIQSGSHSSYVKSAPKGLHITFLDKEDNSLGRISNSRATSLVDYDSAIKIAGSEKNLRKYLKDVEHTIIDVQPGTYEAVHYIKKIEDNTYSKKDLAFCKITWKNADTELKQFTEKEWQKF